MENNTPQSRLGLPPHPETSQLRLPKQQRDSLAEQTIATADDDPSRPCTLEQELEKAINESASPAGQAAVKSPAEPVPGDGQVKEPSTDPSLFGEEMAGTS
jgi:hypothetical protein